MPPDQSAAMTPSNGGQETFSGDNILVWDKSPHTTAEQFSVSIKFDTRIADFYRKTVPELYMTKTHLPVTADRQGDKVVKEPDIISPGTEYIWRDISFPGPGTWKLVVYRGAMRHEGTDGAVRVSRTFRGTTEFNISE